MSANQLADSSTKAHLCEAWVESSNAAALASVLESSLIHCSDSLKALFEDISKASGKLFITELLNYVAVGSNDTYDAITESFNNARTAAETARSWDYGKGPYFSLSAPQRGKLEGFFAKLSSRCQTVSLSIERTNTKFPARAGEANVPQLRATVQLNPNDAAKFDSCFSFVREHFLALAAQNQAVRVLVST